MNTDHTLEEVGKQFDVTRERIRQIEAKALRKLRHPSRSEQLRSFIDADWALYRHPRESGDLPTRRAPQKNCHSHSLLPSSRYVGPPRKRGSPNAAKNQKSAIQNAALN
jgi:hypothetical protein